MDIKKHTHPDKLEYYSFAWSEVRLVIAAVALVLGGVPVLRFLIPNPALSGLVGLVLALSWIISGVASAYLLYRWNAAGQKLFGAKITRDTIAFFVMIISGINLGLAGLSGINIGMAIDSSALVFLLVAIAYLVSGWHLFKRWEKSGRKLF